MTQTNDELIKEVENKIKEISTRLESYNNVDATLTDSTLLGVLTLLIDADIALEKGFVKDACDEIEEGMLNN